MISWIQRSFQLHFRIIFFVLLAVTIVSFIFTIGSTPGIGSAAPRVLHQEFFGLDLTKPGDSRRLLDDAGLSANLRGIGYILQDAAALEGYGFRRVACLALADQLKIPAPTAEELAAQIQTLPIFLGEDGRFDAGNYARFRDNLKTNPRVSEDDIARVLSGDVRVERVQRLLAGPGYVLPGEVEDHLRRTAATWTIAVASYDYAAFQPDIPAAEDALARFYDDHAGNYEVPVHTGVDYVEFRAEDRLGSVKITDDEVRAYYEANLTRFPPPEEKKTAEDKSAAPQIGIQTAKDPAAIFAQVRPQVEQALRTERARILAARVAADLTVAMFEQNLKPRTPPFDAMLAAQNLTLKHAPPLTVESVPAELGWTPEIAADAVRLTEADPVSDALPVGNNSVVLFWRETLPPFRPPLAQVHDRVLADFRENERRRKFVEFGQALRRQLEPRLKAGEPVEKAAAAVEPKLE
ncbi:MAG: hypothetical protein A3G75_03620, partial [Verrucomicrobia bacterium RIFCSPLOWO2_12_FULL_64_8]